MVGKGFVMDKVRVGIIGVGMIGELHALAFAQSPLAELVVICDANRERAKALSEKVGVPFVCDPLGVFDFSVEAVVICLPEHLHFATTVMAIEKGKHILVEKPLVVDLEEGKRIIQKAKERPGLKAMVGHILRFDPRYAQAKQMIIEGKIGELSHFYARRNNRITDALRIAPRTSPLMYLGVHDLDLMLWYAGKRVKRVFALANFGVLREYNVPDTILGLIEFEDGVIGSIELSWILPEHYPGAIDGVFEVVGTKGMIEVEVLDQGLRVISKDSYWMYPDTMHWPTLHGYLEGDLRREVDSFLRCIIHDTPVPVTLEEGFEAVRLAVALEESYREGKEIQL